MKEYLERAGLVIHWVGFVLSVCFLILALYQPVGYFIDSYYEGPLRAYFFLYLKNALISLPLAFGIRYIAIGKLYLFPLSKKPIGKKFFLYMLLFIMLIVVMYLYFLAQGVFPIQYNL